MLSKAVSVLFLVWCLTCVNLFVVSELILQTLHYSQNLLLTMILNVLLRIVVDSRSGLTLVLLYIGHQRLMLEMKQCFLSLPYILSDPAFNQSFIDTAHVLTTTRRLG